MHCIRTTFSAILALVLLLAVAGTVVLNMSSDPPVDPAWELGGDTDIPPGAVTVRFTGTTTLLFSDGETSWMVDGWFSRPGLLDLAWGRIAPDLDAIAGGLAANEATELAAVIPTRQSATKSRHSCSSAAPFSPD